MRTTLRILLGCLLLVDLYYSAQQHYYMPLDGDLPCGVIPDEDVQAVLNDPIGWKALTQEEHVNPNRFFAHASMYSFYRSAPQALQSIVTPLQSPFLANALIKTLVQLAFVLILARLAIGRRIRFRVSEMMIILLIETFFVSADHVLGLGIINITPTYFFFYALPLLLFLLMIWPLAERFAYQRRASNLAIISSFILIPIVFLSSPLNPAVLLVLFLLFALLLLHPKVRRQVFNRGITMVTNVELILFFSMILFAAYSFLIGTQDTIGLKYEMPLGERFSRWLTGLNLELFKRRSFQNLIWMSVISALLLFLFERRGWRKFRRLLLFGFSFIALFLLLIPFGGYRPWRPNVLRNDVLSPVTLMLILMSARGAWLVLSRIKLKVPLAICVSYMIFFGQDMIRKDPLITEYYECQIYAMEQIASSTHSMVIIDDQCTLANWWVISDPEDSRCSMQLMKLWGVGGEAETYVQE